MKKIKKIVSILVCILFVSELFINADFFKAYAEDTNVTLKINKLVDKTQAYTGEEFTYTLQYSNPSTTTDALNVTMTDVLPSNVKYVSNTPSLDVQSVDVKNVDGHDVVTFIFKSPLKAGKSGIVKINAKFPQGTTQITNNDALNSATIKPSNGAEITSNVVTVKPLLKTPDWSISKTKLIPSGIPAIGQPVTYEVRINSNSAIGELNLTDATVVDTLPIDATYVSSTGGGQYSEEKDINEKITKKTVTWAVGKLDVGTSATRNITLLYPAKNNGVGYDISSQVTNTADAYVKQLGSDTQLTKQATVTHGFTTANYGVGTFLKSGRQDDDRYSIGQTAKFTLSKIQNTGNVPLNNIMIEDNIPNELKLTSITTGSYNSSVNLKVLYKTNLNSTSWIPWTTLDSPSNATLNVSSLGLQGSEYITNVRWELTNGLDGIPSGFSETISSETSSSETSSIGVNATVLSKPSSGKITNTSTLTANEGYTPIVKTSSKDISVIDEMPWLVPIKTIKNEQTTYNMNDDVEYKLVIKNNDLATGDYHDPIGVDVVPKELENVQITGWDKGNSSITKDPKISTRTLNDQQLLTWRFNGTLKPGEYVEVYYKAKIIDNTLAGKKTNDFYISSDIDSVYENPALDQLTDTNDLDGDNVKTDKFIKAFQDIFVKFIGSIDAQKWVKGELDSDWHYYGQSAGFGQTLPGGIADYRLVVKNDGANGPISDIVLIDILPTKGDKGVIDTSNRDSTWRPYLVNKITGENGAALDSGIKIYYSTNPNPSTTDVYNPVGRSGAETSDWKLTPPEDITSVTALKFDFGSIQLQPDPIKPNYQIILEWPMRAPLGAPTGEVTWNSFGYGASYPDVNGQQAFLPSEPKKVGFEVQPQPNLKYNLGNYVWEDTNKDGIQNDGETGINGVLVRLYNYGGSDPIKYTRTGLSQDGKPGYYEFPNLPSGHYQVEFVYPKDYKVTKYNIGAGNLNSDVTGTIGTFNDNDIEKYSIKTGDITISGADNLDVDAGLYKVASLGNYVWNDDNTNGIQDSGEAGIDGVTVNLLNENGSQALDDDGKIVSSQVTSGGGKYQFTNLAPGVNYKVQFMNPNRYYKFSNKGAGTAADSDGTASNDGDTTLGDISATTSAIQLKSGENNIDIDQGMYLAQLGDFVWHDLNANGKQDSGEAGINGVTVTLIDKATMLRAKNAYGADIADAVTGANSIGTGKYLFKNLKPGTYQVTFSKNGYAKFSPKDVTITGATDSNDSDVNRDTGTTDDIIIKAGDRNTTVDAGLYNLVSIGDFVWNDLNGDGKQDTGEMGIKDVKVTLLKSDGTLAVDTNGSLVLYQTTLTDGKYQFTNLDPGSYIVKFENPDTEFVFSTKNKTGTGYSTSNDSNVNNTGVNIGKTDATTLNSGTSNQTIDAGMHKCALGDYVWEDLNANGIQDPGEPAYTKDKVTVELLDVNGAAVLDSSNNPIKADISSGKYLFTNINSGQYIVKFNLPSGAFFTTKNVSGSTISNDSNAYTDIGKTDVITLPKGTIDLTWDAGIYKPASIGDYVWEDKNGNGKQDVGEIGINGATVSLYQQGNLTPIKTMTTVDNLGKAGYYLFDGLVPGNYYLKFDMPSGYNSFTFKDNGTDDKLDIDVDQTTYTTAPTDLISDEKDLTWDAGVYKYVSVGDRVFRDTNMNGIQDSDEKGISGVTVNLYKFNGTSYVSKTFATTDTNGNYLFNNLEPGQYKVEFVKPLGYSFTKADIGSDNSVDSDANVSDGKTTDITLTSGQNDLTWDAGLYKLASVGDFVWNDKNSNGIQDYDELGVQGVTVQLFDKNNNNKGTTTTDVNGAYKFSNLEPGDYYLKFSSLPSHYAVTDKDQQSNDALDSDVDTTNLTTKTFTLAEGQDDTTWDMGIYKLSSIGDYVFEDMNANGIQDNGDKPLENVIVKLLDSNGNIIKTTTTLSEGKYLFDDLKKGDYYVQFIKDGYVISPKAAGGNSSLDSDADKLTGKTDKITLFVDDHRIDIDAGLYKPASLGDYVWLDKNNDGKQDGTEPGISGITVNLLDKDGNQLSTTTTGADGKYSFTNLVPSDYYVEFLSTKDYYKHTDANAQDDTIDSDADKTTGKTSKITLVSGESNLTIDAGFTIKTGIKIEKTVYAGHGGGKGTGEELVIGENGTLVTYLFKVTNTGDTYLNNVEINDSNLGIVKSSMKLISGTEPLAPGDSLTYYYETTINGDLTNTASTTGTPSDNLGATVLNIEKPTSEDTAKVDEVKPGIDVQKTIYFGKYSDGKLGDETASGKNGEWVTYLFTVKNTGDTYLNNIEISDLTLKIDKSSMTKISGKEPLAPGASLIYYYETTINGDLTNTVSTTGTPSDSLGKDLPNTKKPEDTDTANAKALGSIGDYLWYDNNADGVQDANETPLVGVKLNLLDKDGNVVGNSTTGSDGKYIFDRLVPGDYTVAVDTTTLPEGLKETYELDKTLDGNVKVTLTPGQVIDTVDFGYYKLGKIGNYVWEDMNGDGIQNIGEKGIGNVTVNLLDKDGNVVKVSTTDKDGYYMFDNLEIGEYKVEFVKPSGYEFTKASGTIDTTLDSNAAANGKTSSIQVIAGTDDMTIDAGLYKPASIGDYLWNDNNADGKQDSGEIALVGVKLNLLDKDGKVVGTATTDLNGKYIFDNLIPGEYTVVVDKTTLPEGLKQTYELDGIFDGSVKVTLKSGDKIDTVDFGYYKLGKIGNYVWEDMNGDGIQNIDEKGIQNVTVNLLDKGGNVINTIKTDKDGYYKFDNLEIGEYKVEFVKPSGYEFTKVLGTIDNELDSNADANGKTSSIGVTAGTDDMTIDSGLYKPASLGDRVWLDKNSNGIQDDGEVGISGITVNLLDKDGKVILATKTTDADGKYSFTNLVPADYYAEFLSNKDYYKHTDANAGDDSKDSDADKTTGKTSNITLVSGESNLTIDAGFTVKTGIKIEKTVYAGHDGGKGTGEELVIGENGTLVTYLFKVTNTGDTYLNNVEINDSNLGIVKSSMKLISGTEPLAPGATLLYYYETTINGDLTNTASTTGTPSDNLGTPVPNIEKPTSEDTAKVDEVKPGIDVQKTIYFGKYSNGKLGDKTASGKNGEWVTYLFTVKNTGDTYLNNIEISDLTLKIDKSSMTKVSGDELLAPGASLTYYYETTINGDLTNTVKVSGTPSDSLGKDLPNTKKPEDTDTANAKALGSIGDYLWYDNNADGVQDASETPLIGVKLNLLDKDGKVVGTATTDSNGKYIFDRLVPGDYTVAIDTATLPEGLKQTYELDKTLDGNVNVALTPGQIIDTVDFGYYKLGKIGNYVWEDMNGDGIQNIDEKGIEDVTVNLLDKDGNVVKVSTTDKDGYYKFDNLEIGEYFIEFVKPLGYEFTKVLGTIDTTKDSNADANGKTSSIKVIAGTDDMTIDSGLYKPASLGDRVWLDKNSNGIQDDGEAGISGVTVNLLDKDGNVLKTTKTDSNGLYKFENLEMGQYYIEFVKLDGFEFSKLNGTTDNAKDSNAGNNGKTELITVVSGQNDMTFDAGLYKVATVNGEVKDSGSNKPIDNAVVTIVDKDGKEVDKTKTDDKGNYKFDKVPTGDDYVIKITKDGYQDIVIDVDINDDEVPLGSAIMKKPDMPKTGGFYIDYFEFGSIITLLGLMLILVDIRKNKKVIK